MKMSSFFTLLQAFRSDFLVEINVLSISNKIAVKLLKFTVLRTYFVAAAICFQLF